MPDCMRSLGESGLQEAVIEASRTKPLLGVCVGEQMLFDWSAEGDTKGLGLLPGRSCVSRSTAACRTTARASRCRRWAGTACARRSRTR